MPQQDGAKKTKESTEVSLSMKQKETILKIVEDFGPLRTEKVERFGLQVGISGGSSGRYLRYLQESGEIIGYKENGNKTKTWRVIRTGEQRTLF